MPTSQQIDVKKLSLDLQNFRTTKQKKEADAIKAMISIKPDRFQAIMESLLDDGYLLTESIQVLKDGTDLVVKEGNRRVAALKLILGHYKVDDFVIPESLKERVRKVTKEWKKTNSTVPCTVYGKSEIDLVNKIVSLTHGKAEKAGRDPWNSMARARHNRDIKGGHEPGLDILEKYLKHGENLSGQQKERWGGEYNITVLEEAMRKLHTRMGYTTIDELVKKYPKINMRNGFEELMRDIGLEMVSFPTIRNPQTDFGIAYGINPPPPPPSANNTSTSTNKSGGATGSGTGAGNPSGGTSGTSTTSTNSTQNSGSGTRNQTQNNSNASSSTSKPSKAHSQTDPKSVAAVLKKFNPRGNGREKVVALRDELKQLKIDKNPIAFCFLLRSMFEISVKVYSKEKHIPTSGTKTVNGKNFPVEKTLREMLQAVTNHLTSNNSNHTMARTLHGAMAELAQTNRLLSVTSMNQLVHSDSFSVAPQDVCRLFHNVYPLLEQMN